jgi:hypothetical protein
MLSADRSQPTNVKNSPAWPGRFQGERDIELTRSAGRDAGHFNRVGRRAWWQGRDVDARLVEYGYHLCIYGVDPPRVALLPWAQCMPPEAPPL